MLTLNNTSSLTYACTKNVGWYSRKIVFKPHREFVKYKSDTLFFFMFNFFSVQI